MITIDNKAGLDYETIGVIIDQYINSGYIETIYYGKSEYFTTKKGNKIYRVTIHYGKNRTKYTIEELKY